MKTLAWQIAVTVLVIAASFAFGERIIGDIALGAIVLFWIFAPRIGAMARRLGRKEGA